MPRQRTGIAILPDRVLLSLKRGTVSARNITLLIDYCVNYYCGLLFNIKYTFVNECFFSSRKYIYIYIYIYIVTSDPYIPRYELNKPI